MSGTRRENQKKGKKKKSFFSFLSPIPSLSLSLPLSLSLFLSKRRKRAEKEPRMGPGEGGRIEDEMNSLMEEKKGGRGLKEKVGEVFVRLSFFFSFFRSSHGPSRRRGGASSIPAAAARRRGRGRAVALGRASRHRERRDVGGARSGREVVAVAVRRRRSLWSESEVCSRSGGSGVVVLLLLLPVLRRRCRGLCGVLPRRRQPLPSPPGQRAPARDVKVPAGREGGGLLKKCFC